MSGENVGQEEPVERKASSKASKEGSAKDKAKAAFEERSKKSSDAIYYWAVIIGFAIMCVACVLYVFKEWRPSPNLVSAISQADIDAHNAAGAPFKRAANTLFKVVL